VKIYNTLSQGKEEFNPMGDVVQMYVCGVTPYDSCHIGHAMSYIIFDVVRRYLTFRGYKIKHVQNFTDIDDKIINRASSLGISSGELAQRYIDLFFEDMDALNVKRADVYPRATQEIEKIIELVRGLTDKGYAYESEGSVYFRVLKDTDYGKLSRRTLDMMMAGARIEPEEGKEHPMDFALWKAAKPGEPFWESPWGKGRPGWHIECSAMSLKYLGEQLDIHGGGQDLIFPHHENEITQSESYTGKEPFVRYWMHNGLLQLGGEKMSKSLGNLITIRQILDKYGDAASDTLRIFVLTSHYRNPLTYSDEVLEGAQKGAERLRGALHVAQSEAKASATCTCSPSASRRFSLKANGVLDSIPFRERFIAAMDDDFNTPQALAALFDLAREINRAATEGKNIEEARKTLKELTDVLGLTLNPNRHIMPTTANLTINTFAPQIIITPNTQKLTESLIEILIQTRRDLRAAKQYQLADDIRLKLADLGITLEDTPKGTVWKKK
jgi:cysteinyl-tRNA synthetase